MVDTVSSKRRSEIMSRIRAKGTKPEMAVRQLAHSMGYRFRLHRADLPGTPDMVFPSRRKLIFVHGCFWHQHSGCPDGRIPKSNRDYWRKKLGRNVERDREHQVALREMGWEVLVIWECQVQSGRSASRILQGFLES